MQNDVFGFGTNQRGVLVRPTPDTRTQTNQDTFAVDCTSPLARDGTNISASWLNEVSGNFRGLVRGNGTTGGGADIVAENHADGMLLQAVLHLIQRGKMLYAEDTGTASNLIVTLNPAPAELIPGLRMIIRANHAPIGAAQIIVNGRPAVPIVSNTGLDIEADDWADDAVLLLCYSGAAWQMASLTFSDIATAFLRRDENRLFYGEDTGAANAIVVSIPDYGSVLTVGREIIVRIGHDNTANCTLNLNGIGPVAVTRPDSFIGVSKALHKLDLRQGQFSHFVYNGSTWTITSVLLGSQSSHFNQSVSTGGILTVSDLGSVIQLGIGSGSYTVTLPLQNTCPNGGKLEFFHNGNTTNVIASQGSDQIVFPSGAVVSSLQMRPGDTLELLSTGLTGEWLVIGGTLLLPNSPGFASSYGSSGWQRLPGGLIIQWGNVTTTSSSGPTYVSLPVTFASALYAGTISDNGASAYTWSLANNGTGSIAIYAKNVSGSFVSGAGGQFIVIGR